MSQNICNICGANYEYHNGRWKCPACGVFKAEELSNEEVTLLYNAAQKLRLCDFDEAEKAYTDIIEKFPKNPNGYWGRLLSRYGIKYEDDFDGRKIPTCYATSIESVITDKDYLKATELADQETRAYYTLQAEYIERVRKEWVEKARKEKPYDIFICYKDSDLANGIDRTQDSIAAQELYIHLTEQGYRVFFSRESLRGKVGEKYEPYIFNALSTAKVLLVYGSKSEYITSTWLKNEWTRYEKRIQAGEKKPNSLIVACDGFSPSELPKVLSSMQCFDATSRSFYTDLDAVLKKIIKGEEKPKPVVEPKPPKKKSKALPFTIAALFVVIAILLGILLPNVFGDKPFATITDSKHGVVISANSKIFDKNTSVIVDKLTDGAQYNSLVLTVNNAKSVDLQNAIIYDIECDVDITKNVTIKVAYSKSSADSTIKVYYVSDDKNLIEEHSCIYDDGFVEFKTNHLSYYVIGEVSASNSESQPTIERVGIRTITFSDKFTAEYVLAKWEGGAKSDASMIEIMDQYGAEQGGGKLHIANPGDFVDEIDEWLFSHERKVGDYAIIENAYGYTICYISSINPEDTCSHIGVVDEAVAPTCTETGLTEGKLCGICDEILVAQEIVPALGHNEVIDEAVAPTCINTGLTEGKHCDVCNEILVKQDILPASEACHDWLGEWTIVRDATCTESGAMYLICSFCQDMIATEGIFPLGHTEVIDEAVAPTYTETGLTEGMHCSVCGEVLIPQETIPALHEHNYTSTITPPTATEDGYTTYICVCGDTYTEAIIPTDFTVTASNREKVGYKGITGENLVIPAVFESNGILYRVVAIGNDAFSYCSLLQSVVIPDSVTSIGNLAFYRCDGLENITLSNNVTRIGSSAFSPCSSLTSITIPDSVTSIGDYAFYKSGLTSITFEGTVAQWKVISFEYRWNYTIPATKVICSDGIVCFSHTEIVDEAIAPTCSTTGLTKGKHCSTCREILVAQEIIPISSGEHNYTPTVTPPTATENGYTTYTCSYCGDTYTETIIPSDFTVTSLNRDMVGYDVRDENLVIPVAFENNGTWYRVVAIGSGAFMECSNLSSVVIPDSVKTIGIAAFQYCYSLESVVIPEGVTSIGGRAFNCCPADLTIPNSVTSIGDSAFVGCKMTSVIIPSGVTTIAPSTFMSCDALTSITIPSSVTSIGENAFAYCSSLSSIVIPASCHTIGQFAFSDTPNLIIYCESPSKPYGWDKSWNASKCTVYWGYLHNGYKVEFDYDKATGNKSVTYMFVEVGTSYTLPVPTKTGYTFNGWYYGSIKVESGTWTVLADATLTAQWTANKYTITYDDVEQTPTEIIFDYNYSGATSSTATLIGGQTLSYPKVPTRSGYVFTGWYTDSDCTTRYNFTGSITGNMTLYAGWKAQETSAYSKIIIDPTNYSSSESRYSISGSGTNSSRQIYIYLVANESGTHYIYYRNDYDYYDHQNYIGIKNLTADVTIKDTDGCYSTSYACVTFTCDAGDVIVINLYEYSFATYAHFYFEGFSTPDSTAVANIGRIEYKDDSTGIEMVDYDKEFTLPTPVRTGYTFGGWYNGDTKFESGIWNLTSDVILTAKWNPNTNTAYTVKHYLENANDNGYTLQDTEILYGTTDSTVSPNTKTYTGFSAPNKASVTILPDGSAVLEYHYTRDTYIVTFVTNGGNDITPITVQYEQFITFPEASRDGYTFGGWFTDAAQTNSVTSTSIQSDLTVYAWWQEETKSNKFNYEGVNEIKITGYHGHMSEVVIPSYIGGIPVVEIANQAFQDNSSNNLNTSAIVSITIPETVKKLGANAFHACQSLRYVTLPDGLTEIGTRCFSYCKSLENIEIPNSVSVIGAYAFEQCDKLENVILPSSLLKIEAGILDATNITTLKIPNSVQEIAEYGLALCFNLKEVYIPLSVLTIGQSAMPEGSYGLNIYCEVEAQPVGWDSNWRLWTWNCGITTYWNYYGEISDGNFRYAIKNDGSCYILHYIGTATDVTIPEQIEGHIINEIGNDAFAKNSKIKTVLISNNIIKIGDGAFANCSGLSEIVIPQTVTHMGQQVFIGCAMTIKCEALSKPDAWEWNWSPEPQEVCPIVWYCDGDIWDGTTSYSFAGGTGTEEDPYLISTAEQLAYVATAVNQGVDTFKGKYLKLTTNIHLMNLEWTPIGNNTYAFEGNFDGGGYSIIGLRVTDAALVHSGLFGKVQDSRISNVTMREAYVESQAKYCNVGILLGFGYSSTNSVRISNCNISGEVDAIRCGFVGGIVGVIFGEVSNSRFSGILYGSANNAGATIGVHSTVDVGGIAGRATTITDCYTEGELYGSGSNMYYNSSYVGGIAGIAETIRNCYSIANISSSGEESSYAGGIVARALYPSVTIENCFYAGNITGTSYSSSDVFCGRIIAEDNETNNITNCHADSSKTITKDSTSYASLQFTQTLQSENFIYNTLGWSSDIWQINEGGFPTLK